MDFAIRQTTTWSTMGFKIEIPLLIVGSVQWAEMMFKATSCKLDQDLPAPTLNFVGLHDQRD